MKILYLTNIPSPYRVDYFNELGKYCDLTVLFEIQSSTERDKSWKSYKAENFKGIVMGGIRTRFDAAFCPSVIKYLKKGRYDYIVLTVLSSPTGILAASWLKMLHIPYHYEGDGGVARKATGFKALLKRFIISSANVCFSTSHQFDEYCITYGAKKERIWRYPFTSIYKSDILNSVPSEAEKKTLKEQLGITEEKFILSVGRILHLKGFDILLKAFSQMKTDWGLYIIGGEADEELKRIIDEREIKNAHFLEFKLSEEVRKYYMAADIFVLPTRYDPWGLVINEAMAAGLPIITTYSCGAGVEMVKQGINGFLYEAEDAQSLKKHLENLMDSEQNRQHMGEESLSVVRNYTIEKMMEAHYHIWNEMR